ncbi:hypothetical protein ACVIWU_006566 [Bradyrhizobium sp. USDA 4509]
MASVAAPSGSATAHSTECRIEIELAGGRRVIVDAGVDVEVLRRIIEAGSYGSSLLRRDPLNGICSASAGAEAIY